MSDEVVLEVRGLAQRYHTWGRKGPRVLDGVDLTLHRGECLALVGPNGAGKTTLLKVVSGLLPHEAGTVDPRGRLSYVPEVAANYPSLTARENLSYLARMLHADVDVDELLEQMHLPADQVLVEAFSKGMQRRLNIAKGLLAGADALLLDEPFEGLDPTMSMELVGLFRSLRSRGTSLLLSSHDLSRVDALADSILALRRGRVVPLPPSKARKAVLVEFTGGPEAVEIALRRTTWSHRVQGSVARIELDSDAEIPTLIRTLAAAGVEISGVRPVPLEEVYSDLEGPAPTS